MAWITRDGVKILQTFEWPLEQVFGWVLLKLTTTLASDAVMVRLFFRRGVSV
jgi:hypothetical protein